MPNITISVTDEIKEEMCRHSAIRWSNAVRAVIEAKLRDFADAERLAQKSSLTEKDVEQLSASVGKSMARHAKGFTRFKGRHAALEQ